MFAHFRMVITLTTGFLLLFGLLPVAVSAMYGGNPPAHIASVLDKQIDTWSWVVRNIFAPISPGSPAAADSAKDKPP